MTNKLLFFLVTIVIFEKQVLGDRMLCYRCNSNQPGCGTPFNWLWYWGEWCPEDTDPCVKVIERKGSEEIITRECLSALKGFRTDIPADKYEGCRPAAKDVRLGHYVNNSITQLDIHRDYYDEVTWCFCFFDNRCNSATVMKISALIISLVAAIHYIVA
ncbi:uncharacterized protein crim [Venturia canescens]|uniref:uncharacterized protein crim n=1 Tax=Venturia canescens TaxID=32260 RepID=UPI001C9D2474|nr:uncharacterized protein LOC122406574 [Venturia canescens]